MFVALVIDLHGEVPVPRAVGSYARSVVEASVRRRVTEASARLGHAAETSPLDILTRLIASESSTLTSDLLRLEAEPVAVVA